MLVTDAFVYVHLPKTGGTFVTAIVGEIHRARGDEVRTVHLTSGNAAALPRPGERVVARIMRAGRDQHGRRADIPEPFRDRPVLGTIRSPYARYVSQYEFAWWRVFPEMFGPVDDVRRRYPAYPDLTFGEFVYLVNEASPAYRAASDPDCAPGLHTQQFVDFFFRDPSAISVLDEEAVAAAWPAERNQLQLLDQAQLRGQLQAFLLQMGYAPAEAALVRSADWIRPNIGGGFDPRWTETFAPALGANVARLDADADGERDWMPYYPPDLRAFVRRKERLLFRLFPQYDV